MTELLPSRISRSFDFIDIEGEEAITVSAAPAGSKKGTGASVNIGPGNNTRSPLSATEAKAERQDLITESTDVSTSYLPKRLKAGETLGAPLDADVADDVL
jgi:hypothetical protein